MSQRVDRRLRSERVVAIRQEGSRVAEAADDAPCVGVEKDLVRIEPVTGLGIPRSGDAVAVDGSDAGLGDHTVPDAVRALGEEVTRLP